MNEGARHPVVSRPPQERFLTIPQTPLCYWLRERFFELLAGRTLGDVADVCQGLATADDARFVRFTWEAPPDEWARPVRGRRWVPFEKGGGYGKWFGHHWWAVDWEHDGSRIKATPGPRVQNEQHYFKEGWTFTTTARGSIGFRRLAGAEIIAHKSSGAFLCERGPAVACVMNCRGASYMVRGVRPQIDLSEDYVSRVSLPSHIPEVFAALETACIALKRHLVALDPTERTFGGIPVAGTSLAEAWRNLANEEEAVAAVLHTLEGLSEREVFRAYGVAGDDLQAVLDETGTPAGWFPLLAGYDGVPDLPEGLEVPEDLLAPLADEPRQALSAEGLSALQRRLRALYEAGPGAKVEDEEPIAAREDGDEEDEAAVFGARIPIPPETFLEDLSHRLEVHPISVYWLLRDLREKDGGVCGPELRRFVEDYVSVTVLRLLGHRWPKQVEAGEPLPAWADQDGIIPLTEGTGEPMLLARVRERIAADFADDRVSAIEREFERIVGKPLEAWLASDFFKRHVSQFRKRPIAWQLACGPAHRQRLRGRGAGRGAPVFSCLVYYHRLDADLLPKVRAQYVGPLRGRLETELGGLEKVQDRSAEQDARRVELEAKVEALKAFDARLEEVVVTGFDCDFLAEVVAKEPVDRWTSRDGRAAPPASCDALRAQERRYDPDRNDGVRVNIAPLQRAGLLAADVLAARDVEKAIADRARWRADERRWCREGLLPRPGWWREESS